MCRYRNSSSAVRWRTHGSSEGKFCFCDWTVNFIYLHLAPYFFRTRRFINRSSVSPAVAEMLSTSSESYILFSDDLFLSALPCSLVLGIFPQGLVAVTVAAQVASISARFSTPVLFFLPVARSHSPQAWKSYLHSPIAHKKITHLIRCLCLAK